MKVIVQDMQSERFRCEDFWVDEPANAEDFGTSAQAYDLARKTMSGAFNVLFYFVETDKLFRVASGKGNVDAGVVALCTGSVM